MSPKSKFLSSLLFVSCLSAGLAQAQQGYRSRAEAEEGQRRLTDSIERAFPEGVPADLRRLLGELKQQDDRKLDEAFGPATPAPGKPGERTADANPQWSAEDRAFRCQATGERRADNRYRLQITDCRTTGADITDQALNGRVFRSYSGSFTGTEAEIQTALAQSLARHVQKEKANPSGNQAATFTIRPLQLEADEKNQVRGEIQGVVAEFVGERLPITKTDQIALTAFYNINSYIDAKKKTLADFASAIQQYPDYFRKYSEVSNALMSLLVDERAWTISLGAGHGSKVFFDRLKSYYDSTGPSGKVVFRTTDYRTKWVRSEFPSQWSHVIRAEQVGVGLEYYGVPGSFLFVFRMIPPGSDPADVSNYGVVTFSPDVWRASFSAHGARDKDVESSFGVDKRYAGDILEVLQSSRSAPGANSMGFQRDWSVYSHRVWVKAPKLY